jgi:demethylmenaquinone methyltransferase/2-methoxy-6-polyprenyl-1,4-benzoquinol methylase
MGAVTAPDPRRAPPPARVRAMFDDVAQRYDLINRLLSFGLDRRWRRAAAGAVSPTSGPVLDLGCGTGDLGLLLAGSAIVVGVDLSHAMLLEARRKSGDRLRLVEGSAFALPFPDGAFDAAVSGFVLRNLEDLPAAFAELARVVAPGGRIGLVDITEPPRPALQRLFDAYFGVAAPALGRLAGRRDAYRYLARSLAQLPPPTQVSRLLEAAGFEDCEARPLTGGMVTLFTGMRAAPAVV